MLSNGCVASYYARARYRMLPLAAFCVACAVAVCAQTVQLIQSPRELLLALRSEDAAAQKGALAALQAADPAMIEGLVRYEGTPGQREIALKVVARMGSKAMPKLFELLADPKAAGSAGSVLFRVLGPQDHARIPELLACAQGNPAAKNYCSQSLVNVSGPKAAAHAPALVKALASPDPLLRAFAATALGAIGKPAGPAAASALRVALKDPVPAVREQAKKALRRVGA